MPSEVRDKAAVDALTCPPSRPLKSSSLTTLRITPHANFIHTSHCGSDFIFTSVLCKIIDVMTPLSEVV